MYQLIALDMDGTLLNSQKKISEGNKRAIEKAAGAGKTVILNTGRGPAELEEYLGELPQVRYLNCVSGAVVYDLKERRAIGSRLLGCGLIKTLLELAKEEGAMPHILGDSSVVQRDQWERMEEFGMGIYKEMFQRVAEKWEDMPARYAESPFEAAKVNIYHRDVQSRLRTKERIRRMGLPVVMAEAEITSLEVSAQGVDKGTGLECLCGYLGLPMSQTIVVGDAANDLQAMKKAGLAVAMGNASQEIKAAAHVVVADCDHDGCAQAVEQYLLGE